MTNPARGDLTLQIAGLQRERDFFRAQCDDLGARVPRLQEDQARAHRDARRWRATARIISASYRSINIDASLEHVGARILAIILENVICDRAALLRARTETEFHVEHAVGYWGDCPDRCHIWSPQEFACVSSRTPITPATEQLRAIVGLPFLLWCFDCSSGYALILGSRSEGNVTRPFEEADRPIVQGALDMFLDLEEKDRLRKEREVLIDELQHRVRNNLQVVYGMLSNELERHHDRHACGIENIARRVLTMAQVYDHLLGRGMSRIVDFGAYLNVLCASLAEFQSGRFGRVELACDVEPVHVDLDTVTSIGLAIAELIANSYEHAFPRGKGRIAVSLHSAEPGRAVVTLRNNGRSFAPDEAGERHGLGLVKRLVQQGRGRIECRSERGTTWTIEMPAVSAASLDRRRLQGRPVAIG